MPFNEQDQVFNEARALGSIDHVRVRKLHSYDDGYHALGGYAVERYTIPVTGRIVAYYDPALRISVSDVWIEGEHGAITAADMLEIGIGDQARILSTYTTRADATRAALGHADWFYRLVEQAIGAYTTRLAGQSDPDLIMAAINSESVWYPDY